jgi:putative ABC transport system permease protein
MPFSNPVLAAAASSTAALRRIWLRPFRTLGAFSLLWLLTLALGIAVTGVCLTQLRQTVLRPLDFPHPEQLRAIDRRQGMCQGCPVTAPLMRDIANIPVLQAAGFTSQALRLSSATLAATSVAYTTGTARLFEVLAAPAQLGRNLQRADADTDAITLADSVWRSQFNANPAVIGQTVRIGTQPKIIVGVMRPGLARVAAGDVYALSNFSEATDDSNFLSVIARVVPAMSAAQLDAGLKNALATSRARSTSYSAADYQLLPQDLLVSRTRWVSRTLKPVLAIVLILALLMAANASSLFAVSVLERIQALSTEMALGASRARLLGGVALQAVSFTLTAAILAALFSPWLFEATRTYLLTGLTTLQNVAFEWPALLWVTLLFTALNVLAAVVPAAIILKNAALTQTERAQTSGAGARFGRRALAVQLVAATAVVMLSLLLLRTMAKLNEVNPGFDLAPIWTAKMILPNAAQDASDPGVLRNTEFLSRVQAAVAGIPGVAAAAIAGDIPLGDQLWNNGDFVVPGAVSKDVNQVPYAQFRPVSAGYAQALNLKVVSGRMPQWRPGAQLNEAAVNEEYVKRFMPGIDPVGRVIADRKLRIVGVLQSVQQVSLSAAVEPDVYAPFAEFFWYSQAQLIVRMQPNTQASAAIIDAIRQAVRDIDASVPIFEPQTGTQLRESAMRDATLLGRTVLTFAVLSVLTTALGLFGLCAFAVTRRKREFGLRLAIGASPTAVVREIVQTNLRLSGLCAAAGLVLGFFLSTLISSNLFGVARYDFASALGAALVIATISALASLLPAWRASQCDPLSALRAE